MSNATLIGRNRVTEAEVLAVPPVEFTRTFKPVHHKEVINALRTGISACGLEVTNTEYVLASEGMKMFGVWDLDSGTDELCWSIGFRNSLDKSIALGLVAGTRVYLCENLAMSGEFLEMRRHTKGLTVEELELLAYRAIRALVNRLTKFQEWHLGLKQYDLSEGDAKILLVELISQSVFPASKFNMLYDLYFKGPTDRTLWGFHETSTNVMKEANLLTLPKKNRVLNAILNQHIENLNTDQSSALGNFYESRARLAIPETIN